MILLLMLYLSTDALIWGELPDALHTGNPGSYDDGMLWTMSVIEFENQYNVLYGSF